MNFRLTGLVTATHTPFHEDGRLWLEAVDRQAEHLIQNGARAAFIGGTTGESHSLTVDERLQLAERWLAVTRGTSLGVVVHVGANCLVDARTLARQAQSLGATALSALSPSYFKPNSVESLVACVAQIAEAAPDLPFYFYDIPSMTGVSLSIPGFLAQAVDRIPNLVGVKFTNPDLIAFQKCLHAGEGRFDMLWGMDECLLGALAMGARGTVGSTYNFAAPIYHRLFAAFDKGDLATARLEQYRSVRLVDVVAEAGYMASARAVMGLLGVPVGPPRLPHGRLDAAGIESLRSKLETLGFFDWIRD